MSRVISTWYAVMAELADAHGSGPCEATHGGSNPFDRTMKGAMTNEVSSVWLFLFVFLFPRNDQCLFCRNYKAVIWLIFYRRLLLMHNSVYQRIGNFDGKLLSNNNLLCYNKYEL